MNVVAFPHPNLNDIPLMARRLADAIENGDHGAVAAVVVVMVAQEGLQSFGWGDCDDQFKVIGILDAGKHLHLAADQ